jgi:conjugal transfer/entry exclusion protein
MINMTKLELEKQIQDLKNQLSDMEQRLVDDKYVDMHIFREILKELNWLRVLRDTDNYEDDEE